MGGVEQTIHQLAAEAARQGVETDVLALTGGKSFETTKMDGYNLHRVKCNLQIASTGISLQSFPQFFSLARKADLIHYHFPWPFMDLVHFATRPKKPTVLTYHSDIVRQKFLMKLYRPLQERFLLDVNQIVATSPNYLATSEVLGAYRSKVSVIPIGLNKQSYPRCDPARSALWSNRLGPKFFLFVGVFRYYKGLHILLEAAQGTSYPVAIVGAGPIEHNLKLHAARLGLRNVHFLGPLPDEDKVALLELCHAVVFPSHLRAEAFGISLLEGAMFGKPMISSEIGTGTTFVNISGETGLVVPPSDAQALRDAMTRLWCHPEEAAEMGMRAKLRYQRFFTAEKMADSYIKLYRKLVAPPRMACGSASYAEK